LGENIITAFQDKPTAYEG